MSARTDRAMANRAENLQHRFDQHRNVVTAHDHVHPDRNDCGGVGGCVLLMSETELEQEIEQYMDDYVRAGYRIVVTLERA